MNRIKRISMQLLDKYGDVFTTDFDKNKETLERVAVFRSKGLRNEVAGYITSIVKSEMDSEESQVQEEEGVKGEGAGGEVAAEGARAGEETG